MGYPSERLRSPANTLEADDIDVTDDPGRVADTLRRARQYRGWSLREVERRTGRANAYLSQVERGVIRRPDPAVLLQLADLYSLNFDLLMQWSEPEAENLDDPMDEATTRALIRQIVNLTPQQRRRALELLQGIAKGSA
ncbi:helix-turn-helix domain-containing protein [Umezawaea sp. NPDC059074]|uniref:helix-turn-helix domain-containing protein n=1 Tax=Umezawaea sp. NPDC059074 TaxID=3346716 RepID=UPI003689A03A